MTVPPPSQLPPPYNPGANRHPLLSGLTRPLLVQGFILSIIQIIQWFGRQEWLNQMQASLVAHLPLQAQAFVNTFFDSFYDVDAKVTALFLGFLLGILGLSFRGRYRYQDSTISWILLIFGLILAVFMAWKANPSLVSLIIFVVPNLCSGFNEKFDFEYTEPKWASWPILRWIFRRK